MALVVADRVQETSSTSGTGTLTLSGAVAGYQTFSSAIGNTNTTYYTIYDTTSFDWEVGIGTVGSGTLTRDVVLSNSLGTTAKINLAGNVSSVFCTYPAEKSINYDVDGVATIGEVLNYADTGIIASFASTVAGYNQVVIQNKSTATNASANFNVSNDASTGTTGFAELGINSSTFTGTGSFNIAGASYLASASTDLTIGTYGAYNVHFVTNSNTTDAMTIFNSGGVSLGGYGDPGLGTLYANNVYLGFTIITAAAGTTTLTNASSAWQQVVGTTTQTIKLPDATTLFEGFAFTIANNSTGAVTVVDNASATLDTAVTGGTAIMVLLDNSTVAGTWEAYSYLPSTYDFSTTTANFGNAIITNALWNGTTIATGYGGTGLTTFSAANNALYSTSSSALTAGTLPIEAGGTAKTTFTSNGVVYGNGTSALGVTAAGATGEVLVGNTGSAPSWSTISSSLVSSFQTSLSGLTPSSATTGAVTLAGTLGISSGGTGTTTSFTTGSVVFAGASGVYTQNNAQFFWDNTNNRLGIGTTSPATKLDVAGTSATSYPIIRITDTNTAAASQINAALQFYSADPSTPDGASVRAEIDIYANANGGASDLRFLTNGGTLTEAMRIDSSRNVSIGNTGDNNTRVLNFTTSSGGSSSIQSVTVGTTNQALTFSTTYTTLGERMRIDGAGNVGIGTTSPSTYGTLAIGLSATGSSVNNVIGIYNSAAVDAASLRIAGYSYANTLQTAIDFIQNSLSNFQSQIAFSTYSGSALIERMRIDSSGNVGIGNTPSGSYKLEVTGKTYSSGGFVPRSLTLASTSGAITPDSDSYDQVNYSLTGSSSFSNPSGTPVNGQKLSIRIYAASTQTISSWSSSTNGYRAIGTTLPTSVAAGKTVYVGCVWNSTDSFWDVVAVATQA